MIDIKKNTLLREIPANLLADPKVEHMIKSLQKPLDDRVEWIDKINFRTDLESLPDEIIEHLLWENHITPREGLALAISKAEKIALIKSAKELHRLKGTKLAIERIFFILDLDAMLEEWFEYSGDPYHFRLDVEVSKKGLTESQFWWLENLLKEYKNERSWLERIRLHLKAEAKLHLAGNISGGEKMTMYPKIERKVEQYNSIHLAGTLHEGETVLVRPILKTRMEHDHKVTTTATVTSGEEITVKPYELKNINITHSFNMSAGTLCAEQTTIYPVHQKELHELIEMSIGAKIYSAEEIAAYPL